VRLIERATMSRYHINVSYSDEDRAWVADIPDLQYCSAFGRRPRMVSSRS